MTSLELIKQGAEGKLYRTIYDQKPCLIKERFVKNYRHPDLDKQLTKSRIRAEEKAIKRCEIAGVLVPKIYKVNIDDRKIYMEYFDKSKTAKDFINELFKKNQKEKLDELTKRIGEIVGKMHASNIIHGDLTTSNMLINPKDSDSHQYDIIMIDFGLSSYSTSVEDKGVDLYVLERALLSTHSDLPDLFEKILESYKSKADKNCNDVLTRFEEVRARGRKRTMVG
jgi:TP53 regulating kinase-like protein